ncbi:MATE efflux family protein [Stachybotrys elegans]|uniref:MATE efflux family protein n=1 Tax=Stachybotrys elegans TaxID=80388 RepID=A0A8K0WSK5_9HYPO|nr:MATE efflux family protein [Stachybotrys elegans]
MCTWSSRAGLIEFGTDVDSPIESELTVSALFMRPGGITFSATTRPTLAPQETERPGRTRFATNRERRVSRNAERSLLRDNHLLPPKHGHRNQETTLGRVYRYLFSTKIRDGPLAQAISETTPLLPDASEPLSNLEARQWQAAVATNSIQTTWQRETLTLATYARSLAAAFLLHYSVTIVSIFTVGRIGPIELAAVSLATVTANITCYTPIQGLATSLDTLCSQAFGSGHKGLVGLQCQRMLFLLWALLVPLVVLWCNADGILSALIPERETAMLAAQYLRLLCLGAPGVAAFETAKRFVQAQGLFHVTTYVLIIGAPFNIFANWFFVFHLGWGFRAFVNWGPMIRLALPGMIMIEAQYFAFEVLTLVAGQFGGAALAAQSVLVTLGSTAYQVPFAVSIAASTRVANLIGARLSHPAWTSAQVSLVAGLLVGLLNMATLLCLRSVLPGIFTNDAEVAEQVANVIPVVAILQVFDATAAVSHGCLRGIGRQYVGGYTNLVSFYVVALPVSFATSFLLGWKLPGLWVGVTIGVFIINVVSTTMVETLYLYTADWESAVHEAEMRMRFDASI